MHKQSIFVLQSINIVLGKMRFIAFLHMLSIVNINIIYIEYLSKNNHTIHRFCDSGTPISINEK
jgi:hypothetical protein